jgi:hypothetical protein
MSAVHVSIALRCRSAKGLARAKNLLVHFQRVGVREEPMAKGQKRSSKEAKKPKANKPKTSVSDYKKSVITSGHK